MINKNFGRDDRYKVKQYRWDLFEEAKKVVNSVVPGAGDTALPGISELIAPGSGMWTGGANMFLPKSTTDLRFDGWDNPFSNLAAELSGRNGSVFNPFALGANLGDKNAMEWRDKWQSMQNWAADSVHSNVDNIVGEISGSNKQRQKDWENKVEQQAKEAQAKYFQEQIDLKQASDLSGSRAAGNTRRGPGQRGRGNLSWAANGADVTDFLGL